jgi:hypothetical protein
MLPFSKATCHIVCAMASMWVEAMGEKGKEGRRDGLTCRT